MSQEHSCDQLRYKSFPGRKARNLCVLRIGTRQIIDRSPVSFETNVHAVFRPNRSGLGEKGVPNVDGNVAVVALIPST